jgi:hypothetical protein
MQYELAQVPRVIHARILAELHEKRAQFEAVEVANNGVSVAGSAGFGVVTMPPRRK